MVAYDFSRRFSNQSFNLPKDAVRRVFTNHVDKNNDGKVSVKELDRAIAKLEPKARNNNKAAQLIELFDRLANDLDRRNSVSDKNGDRKLSFRGTNSELDKLAAIKSPSDRLTRGDFRTNNTGSRSDSSCGCSGSRWEDDLDLRSDSWLGNNNNNDDDDDFFLLSLLMGDPSLSLFSLLDDEDF